MSSFSNIILTLFLVLAFAFSSCRSSREQNPMELVIQKVESEFAKIQYSEKGLVLSRFGGGGNGRQFTQLVIGFRTNEKLQVTSAREILVTGVIDYYNFINNYPKLQEYLIEHPFPMNRIQYNIQVSTSDGSQPRLPKGSNPDNKISFGYYSEGQFHYVTLHTLDDPATIVHLHTLDDPATIVHKETLEEAIAILEEQGVDLGDYGDLKK